MAFDLTSLPAHEKCFIIFQGAVHVEGDMGSAESLAADLCSEAGDKATILVVPRASLRYGIVAVNQGVVLHSLNEIDEDN